MNLFALPGERDVLVTDATVYEDGRELTGAEVAELIGNLDKARLATLWQETNREVPLDSWVVATGDTFEGRARVIDYRRGAPGHEVKVAPSTGRPIYLAPAEVEVVPAPGGAMNFLRMLTEFVRAALAPARGRHRPRPNAEPTPVQPQRQARRTFDADVELIARDYPEWRIIELPAGRGFTYAAMASGVNLRADTPTELRARIRAVEEELPRPSYCDTSTVTGGWWARGDPWQTDTPALRG